MKKSKLDIEFIKNNKTKLIQACISNAKNKVRDADILIANNSFSTAHALQIIALEDLSKAAMINDDFVHYQPGSLLDHKKKAIEMINLSASCYGSTPAQSDYDWAQVRIPAMREDCLYARITPTQYDMFSPNEQYWMKRTKSFNLFLKEVLKKAKTVFHVK